MSKEDLHCFLGPTAVEEGSALFWGAYTLGGYGSRATDFAAGHVLTCPRRKHIEDPITQALFRELYKI